MTYFIALIILLLPSYLIRFTIFNIPTTLLEVLIYTAFIWTIVQKILNSKSDHSTGSGRPEESRTGETLNKSQIPNPKQSIIPYSSFLIPIILFIISGIISAVIAPDKREALGLLKAYIIDPILFFYIIVTNLSEKKETLNTKSDHSTGSGRPEESRTGETLNKFQIPNSKSQTLRLNSEQVNSKFEIPARLAWRSLAGRQNPKHTPYTLHLTTIFNALIVSGVVVALHAIWQKITGQVTTDGRVLGIFGYEANASPNYLAFYLAPITTLALSSWFLGDLIHLRGVHSATSEEGRRFGYLLPLLHVTCYLLLVLALWFTGSRAAIGAVIIGVISYLVIRYWQQIKFRKILVLMFICSIVLMMAIAWQFTKPDWSASRDSGRISSSNNIRWEIWNTTVKDIIPHNLVWLKGVGLGNYQEYFSELTKNRVNFPEWIAPKALTPHNFFLNIWVNLGLLGLISFVWLIILFFLFAIRSIRYWRGGELLLAIMITILLQGLVDSPYWKNDLAVMFWMLLAFVY